MNRLFWTARSTRVLATAALSGAIGLMAATGAFAQDAADGHEWTTPEQIERGDAAYQQRCASCHGADIVSIYKSFPNAALFYGFISTTMPGDSPGSLPAQQYADIIAYLSAENGLEPGTEDLPADDAILATIKPSEFEKAAE